ncbi:MAG: PASTA domain-containing protein [Rhodothermaceae bacterium]|nr:PASTA domain-containing protein [Rhodothermaceae bacterium]
MASFSSRVRDGIQWIRPVLTHRSFWLAMLTGVAALGMFVLLLNFAVMPLWTRHDAAVTVPEVRRLPAAEAAQTLERAGLRAEMREQPYNPNLDADMVVDQTPLPNTAVKPGRRIYYYVNVAPREMVRVPDVVSLSEGRAKPTLTDAGLLIGDVRMDTLRTPYEGTVTRQTPQGGHAVPRGTQVTLWLSPGFGRNQVRVPDVTGLPPAQARQVLREAGLWVESPEAQRDTVRWQEPRGGNRLREGSEVRIHITEPPENWNAPPPPPREPTPDEESADEGEENAEDEQPEAAPAEPLPAPADPPPPPREPQEDNGEPAPTDDDGDADESSDGLFL